MPDYNLGRAHGRIEIEYDDRNVKRADRSVGELDDTVRHSTQTFDQATRSLSDHERQTQRTSETTRQYTRIEQEANNRRAEANRLSGIRKEAEEQYRRVMSDTNATLEDQVRVEQSRNKARGDALQASKRAAEAERALKAEISGNTDEVKKFISALNGVPRTHRTKIEVDTRDGMRSIGDLHRELRAVRALTKVSILGFGGAQGVGALGGLAGLLGSGATGLGIQGIVGITGAISDMAGALGTLPGVIAAVSSAQATWQVSMLGIEDSLGVLGEAIKTGELDAQKFGETLKGLSPSAQNAMVGLANMLPVIREMTTATQESFFSQFVDDIKPLIGTYLPLVSQHLQNMAELLGGFVHGLAEWAQQSSVVRTFGNILGNIEEGFRVLQPIVQPVADSILSIVSVSSQFLPQIAGMLVDAAKEFNKFVQTATANGEFAKWISDGIQQVKLFVSILSDFGKGFIYIGRVANEFGGGMLKWLKDVSSTFLEWVQSVEGQTALRNFFSSTSAAVDALLPLLKTFGNILFGTIIPGLADLGTNLAPGFQGFLNILAVAFQQLFAVLNDPQTIQAINGFLVGLGMLLQDIVAQAGPALPQFLENITNLFGRLIPVIGPAVNGVLQLITQLVGALNNSWDRILAAAKQIVAAIETGMRTGDWSALIDIVKSALTPVANSILDVIIKILRDRSGDLVAVMLEIFGKLTAPVLGMIKDALGPVLASAMGDAGEKAIKGFIGGMIRGIPFIGPVLDQIAQMLPDWLKGGSPTRKGPLSRTWPEQWGEKAVKGFAEGMTSATGEVASAGDTVAGVAVGSLGGGGKGGSMEGFRSFLKDIQQLMSFANNIKNLFQDVSNQIFNVFETIGKLPGPGGKPISETNPLYRKSFQRTVSDADLARQRADEAYRKQLDQQNQDKGKVAVPPNFTPGGGEGTIPLVQNPDGTWTSTDPEWAKLIARESGGIANRPQEIVDSNTGGNEASGLFQIAKGTWASNGGGMFAPTAGEATPEQQAQIAAKIFREQGVGPWGGRESEEALRRGLTGGGTRPPGYENYAGPGGVYPGDEALLSRVPAGQWVQTANNDLTKGLADCSSAVEDLVNIMDNRPTEGRSLSTNNADQWLRERGFLPTDQPVPGAFNVAFNVEHMQATLPGGTNFNWGSDPAAAKRGLTGQGAYDPALTSRYYRPVSGAQPQQQPVVQPGAQTQTGPITTPGRAPQIIDVSGQYKLAQSERGRSPDLFLVHTEEGTSSAQQLVESMAAGGKYSYNYYIDPNTGQILQGVAPSKASVGTGGVNERAINAVIAGSTVNWTREQWLAHPQALQSLAYLAATSGVPLQQLTGQNIRTQGGIGGHDTATAGGYPTEGHTDPGANFPWGEFMQIVGAMRGTAPGGTTTPFPALEGATAQDFLNMANDTTKSLSVEEQMRDALLEQNGLSRSQIEALKDPALTSDEDVIGGLGKIEDLIAQQNALDTPQGRMMAQQLQGISTDLQSARGITAGASPIEQAKNIANAGFSIAGQVMDAINGVIESWGAAADLTERLVYGVRNTEDIMGIIDNIQTFIQTAAQIVGAAGSIISTIGGFTAGSDFGATAAAGAVTQGVAAALSAINNAIEIGQQGYRIATKYLGEFLGYLLGGPATGALTGNVRMLLNTKDWTLQTYSQDNPDAKNTFNAPGWSHFWMPTAPAQQQNTQLNIYAGPGQPAHEMLNESMWLVNTGNLQGANANANF